MGITQAIGKGFLSSTRLLKVVLIFFIFNFVMGLIMLPFAGPENIGKPQVTATALALSLVSILIFIFLQGGALGLIRDLLKNNSFSLSDFISNGKKYYLRILGLFLAILAVAFIAIIILALIASGILAVANNTFTKALITAIIIVISIVAAVLLLFPIYIIVVEDKGPIEAIKDGFRISTGNFWRVFGLFLFLLIIVFGMAFIIGIITAFLGGTLPLKAGQVVMLFMNSILQSYLSIVMMAAFMVYYLDLSSTGPAGQQQESPSSVL